ncbi:MAG: hypothetical protein J6A52_06250 [Bacilli bacterium]|nr:hypothetical protein [Bacilli bacterium]
MKIVMKILSVLLVLSMGIIIIGLNFDLGDTFENLAGQILLLSLECIFPIIIIAVACLCLQKKNEGILMNTILAIETVAIVLASVSAFLPLYDINETLYNIINTTKSIISTVNIYILCFSLLRIVNPNNLISNITQKTGYIALLVNIAFQVWLWIKKGLVDVLPNVYGHDGFDFASIAETSELVAKIYLASFIVVLFAIILTFITNHAFEIDTIDVDQVDYDELKKQADSIAQNKFNDIYSISPNNKKEEPKQQVQPTQPGVMNINNQLGVNSNVGQIENKQNGPTTSFVDKAIPTSNGPVVNSSLTQNTMPQSEFNASSNQTNGQIQNNTMQQVTPQNTPLTPEPTPLPVNPMLNNNQMNTPSPLAQALGNAPQSQNQTNNTTNKFLN